MDELILLDISIGCGNLDLIISLFRVNKSTYNKLNLRLLESNLKLPECKNLRQLYLCYLIRKELNNNNYVSYTKLCAKYNTDFLYKIIRPRLGCMECCELAINNGAIMLLVSLLKTRCIINIKDFKLLLCSSIKSGNIDILKIIVRNTPLSNYTYSDLLSGKYHLCGSKMMYELFRKNKIRFLVEDVDKISKSDMECKVLKFIFKDEDKKLFSVKKNIWKNTNENNREFILKTTRSDECIRFLYDDLCNNKIHILVLDKYIRCMGVDKAQRGIDLCKDTSIYYTAVFDTIKKCVEEIRKVDN